MSDPNCIDEVVLEVRELLADQQHSGLAYRALRDRAPEYLAAMLAEVDLLRLHVEEGKVGIRQQVQRANLCARQADQAEAEVKRLRQELADALTMKEHMATAVLEGLKGTTHPDDTDGVMCLAWTAEHIRERVAMTLEAEVKRLTAELAKVDAWSQQHLRNHAEVVAENERLRAERKALRSRYPDVLVWPPTV